MKVFWQTTALLAVFVLGSVTVFAGKGKGANSGKAIPYIGDNEASANFIANRLEKDTGLDAEHFAKFSKGLAKSLSQFDAAAQNEVWYGS